MPDLILGGAILGVPQYAMKWYRKAAEQGYADAEWRLGTMYANGESVAEDYLEAEKWLRLAASHGHPNGYFWLGHLHLHGLGVSRNVSEAVRFFVFGTGLARSAGAVIHDGSDASVTPALNRHRCKSGRRWPGRKPVSPATCLNEHCKRPLRIWPYRMAG